MPLRLLQLIAARRILARGGILAIHLSKEEEKGFPDVLGDERQKALPERNDIGGGETAAEASSGAGGQAAVQLQISDRRLYGGSLLLFFSPSEAGRNGEH